MIRLSLLLAALALVQAPPPDRAADLYHAGAQAYIEGDNAAALEAVEAGLDVAPNDPKLQALRELLEQQQDPQDQNDGGQNDESEDSEAGDEGEQNEEQDQGEQPDDGQEAEQDETQTRSSEAQAGEAPEQPAGREAESMTRAQAERILDAVGGEEELLLRELRRAPTQRSRSDKDW